MTTRMNADDILANAERLISDARYLYGGERRRSAATLIVVALEQFGAFVEAFTREAYPGASVWMGLTSDKVAHAKRQDALAAHIMGYAFSMLSDQFCFEIFFEKTGCGDREKFLQWLINGPKPIEFTASQKQRLRDSADMKAANLLLHMARNGQLKQLREFGLYENVEVKFSDAAIAQALELTEAVQQMLVRSRHFPLPEPIKIAGINMPEGQIIVEEENHI